MTSPGMSPPGEGWFRVESSDAGVGGPGWMRVTSQGNDYRPDVLDEPPVTATGGVLVKTPIPMRLPCPACSALHVDESDFATRPHHTHACQECGNVRRPAIVDTVGVRFLPGFRNEAL